MFPLVDITRTTLHARLAAPPQGTTEQTLRETVNACIDALQSTLLRLLDLPLPGVLLVSLFAAGTLGLGARWLGRTSRWPRTVAAFRAVAVLLIAGAVCVALERRLLRAEERVVALQARATASACAMLETLQQRGLSREALLVDVEEARAGLQRSFAGVDLRAVVLDEATDLVLFHLAEPMVCGALAVIDLQSPVVRIEIDADFTTKGMTSAFGEARGCTVAINGEAGNSPHPNCGLGPWRGPLRVNGETLMQETPGNARPFLCFDAGNHARFVAQTATDRALRATDCNVIWGRVDAIAGGVQATDAYRFNQPRTVMGIDRDGNRLFLLVVDGRQPRRSVGFTSEEVARFLQAFHVHDAMLCDEGGSACMFVDAVGGLVTTPSDNRGEERPTYTHFGVARRATAPPTGR